MANEAQVSFTGYVATEPAFKLLDDGTSITTLRVASTPRRFNRQTGEWADGQTSFMSVACWRKLGENVAMCLRKGEPVVVVGTMRVRHYNAKDGSPRLDVEVEASSIGHDLCRGVARFQRTRGSSGGGAAAAVNGAAGEPADLRDEEGDMGIPEPGHDAVAELPEDSAVVTGRDGSDGPGTAAPSAGPDGEADDVLDDQAVAALLEGDSSSVGEEAAVPL